MRDPVEIKKRPIQFSSEMMGAIRRGIKVVTRRVVTPQPVEIEECWPNAGSCVSFDEILRDQPYYIEAGFCPYGQPGDLLWTRENWRTVKAYDQMTPTEIVEANRAIRQPPYIALEYADGLHYGWPEGQEPGKWRPARYMPRVFSRCLLEVKAIRIERLQAMTRTDAMREGIKWSPGQRSEPLIDFAILWDSLHPVIHTWASNPYVWVIDFNLVMNELMDEEVGETLKRVNFHPRPNPAQRAMLVQSIKETENG